VEEQVPVQAVKLDGSGLARLFGELEARVMEAVWSLKEPTVHDICRHVGQDCHYKTVMTVANRLVDKGALARRREGRAYVYISVAPRDQFLEAVSRQTIAGLMNDFGDAAIAGFLDALGDVAPEQLQALRQLIEDRMGGA
jgi:predicted transcriptional regulator